MEQVLMWSILTPPPTRSSLVLRACDLQSEGPWFKGLFIPHHLHGLGLACPRYVHVLMCNMSAPQGCSEY